MYIQRYVHRCAYASLYTDLANCAAYKPYFCDASFARAAFGKIY